jgi:hypothetical protein
VVQADGPVAEPLQALGCGLALLEARRAAGQGVVGNQPLVAFHVRHMGIAEEGDAVGFQTCHGLDGRQDPCRILMGQAVHEVAIDRAEAGGPQAAQAVLRDREGLIPVDRLLHLRMDVLDS